MEDKAEGREEKRTPAGKAFEADLCGKAFDRPMYEAEMKSALAEGLERKAEKADEKGAERKDEGAKRDDESSGAWDERDFR